MATVSLRDATKPSGSSVEPSVKLTTANLSGMTGAPEIRMTNYAQGGINYNTDAVAPASGEPAVFVLKPRSDKHEVKQLSLPEQAAKKIIDAVVSRVEEDSVSLIYHLPSGDVEMSLSRSLIDDDLAEYGTPVALSIEIVDNARRPVFRRREVEPKVQTDQLREIDKWLKA